MILIIIEGVDCMNMYKTAYEVIKKEVERYPVFFDEQERYWSPFGWDVNSGEWKEIDEIGVIATMDEEVQMWCIAPEMSRILPIVCRKMWLETLACDFEYTLSHDRMQLGLGTRNETLIKEYLDAYDGIYPLKSLAEENDFNWFVLAQAINVSRIFTLIPNSTDSRFDPKIIRRNNHRGDIND